MAEKSYPSPSLSKPVKSKQSQANLDMKITVPIKRSDKSMFDDEFASMKRKFANEMRRIEAEMTQFSTDLVRLTGETTALQSGVTSSEENKAPTNWDVITKSPLVEQEGKERVLKLIFDVTQFHPDEVTVKILNDILIVTAVHKEKKDDAIVFNEFNREFQLPKGTDPETVKPIIDKDGVLTVKVPLALEYNAETKTEKLK